MIIWNEVYEKRIQELQRIIERMEVSESNLRDREKQLIERNKFLESNQKIVMNPTLLILDEMIEEYKFDSNRVFVLELVKEKFNS